MGAAGVSASVTVDIQETLDTVVGTIEGVVNATGAIGLVDNITGDVETYVAGLLSKIIAELNGTLGNVETVVGVGKFYIISKNRCLDRADFFFQTRSPNKSPASPPNSAASSVSSRVSVSRTSSPPSPAS